MAFVYIVRCSDGSLYTGSAVHVDARIKAHNDGRGAKYTCGRRPVTLVYSEQHDSMSAAMRREHVIKQLTRTQKRSLILKPEA